MDKIKHRDMSTFSWILIGLVLGIGLLLFYRKGKVSRFGDIDSKVKEFTPEHVDSLSLKDVKDYFQGLHLQKGKDTPFIYHLQDHPSTPNSNLYFLAVFDEESQQVKEGRLLDVTSIEADLRDLLGTDPIIVLS